MTKPETSTPPMVVGLDRKVGRLGNTQRKILQRLADGGGEHVFLGCGMREGCLSGYFWEEIDRSLLRLIARGLVIEVKQGFYSLPPNLKLTSPPISTGATEK